jgi:ribonucleoside-diphosphate reductase alpha chain
MTKKIITSPSATRATPTIPFKRVFTKEGVSPFKKIKWVKREATIGGEGKKVFEQKDVVFPDFWSQNAVNITVSKYFRGKLGSPERETDARQMITRVTSVVRGWGEKFGYFADKKQAQAFEDELTHILVHQKGSFNSPVWFNVGTKEEPQCSACFILAVEDTMGSILDWIHNEGMIFKRGSGAGINLSNLRSKKEHLSLGGYASGPVSFMRGADSVAGMIKSGGATRRAAKMVVLNVDHPDIMDFIRTKAEEEKKVRALMEAGYNMADLNNEAWNSIQYQNANNSVRITDEFMKAVEEDGEWHTRLIKTGKVAETFKARDLLHEIAKAAWECGDPGVQYDTIINKWHTCPNSGRINASNPCSEYMHLDNSACNLASINLMKFLREDGSFAVEEFMHTVQVFILAQEIIVGGSSYPTEEITKNAKAFRELGLGFANLGALLMTKGIAYDSEEGRAWAGAIASLMAGEAYRYSAEIARRVGTFDGYAVNRAPMLKVIKNHGTEAGKIKTRFIDDEKLAKQAQSVWKEALELGKKHGYRNSQVTVIAPTGTISFMMDCDTTGIEPDFSLVKMKQLVGGGWMKIVNESVEGSLLKLGYSKGQAKGIVDYIVEHGTPEGAPEFKEEHLPIFDCAVKPAKGTRAISWQGHVKMVAAVQPFISGAISKTFNMAHDVTQEEIEEAYVMAWKLGIKAFAVYRDGSKATQPLNTSGSKEKKKDEPKAADKAIRQRLPASRASLTHRFVVAGHKGYLTYSVYEDGKIAEIFVKMAKQGSTLSGLLDAFAISVSMALQYGVPLKALAHKFIYSRFEPAGFTENPDIRIATSIIDYIFRFLALSFLSNEDLAEFGMERKAELEQMLMSPQADAVAEEKEQEKAEPLKTELVQEEPAMAAATLMNNPAPKPAGVQAGTVCRSCGGMMVRTGTCMTCFQCGNSSGGCS